jgi:hypothetical protein
MPVVDTTENTIFLGMDHGLTTGQAVKYDNNDGTSIQTRPRCKSRPASSSGARLRSVPRTS